MNNFHKTRIVTKNFISDYLQGIRSLFGLRMVGYESLVMRHIDEMMAEIKFDGNVDWYRMQIDDVSDAFQITIYGCYK